MFKANKKGVKTFQKQPPVISNNPCSRDADDDVQFEVELCWCIHQLEDALNSGKLSKKIEEDTIKNLKSLKSKTAPLIKKRQVMKAAFGDYRAKMQAEEKKMRLGSKQIKFTTSTEADIKHNFVKKAAFLSSGKDFRFNFNPPPECQETELPVFSHDVGKLNLTSGSDFKFNFQVQVEANDDNLKMDKLSIKS